MTAELVTILPTETAFPALPAPRHAPPESGSQLVLSHLRRGEERAAELATRLAQESGSALVEIYETLRRGIYLPGRTVSDFHVLASLELDERLARLATRLPHSTGSTREPEALIVTTGRRGISSCLQHLLGNKAIPARSFDLGQLARHARVGAPLLQQFGAVRYVILDAANSAAPDLIRQAVLLDQLRLVNGHLTVVVLADDTGAATATRGQLTASPTVVSTLPELMAKIGLLTESPLTTRERDVLEYVSTGATNRQTASALGISIATVKTYLERSQVKLKSQDRASAVATALRRGWL